MDDPKGSKNALHYSGVARNLDLNLLRVFETLMVERNVQSAADRLGRTQSAISHALARLRSALNDELFVRSMGEMLPTPVAKELASELLPALTDIYAKLDRRGAFDPASTKREFAIGITDYTAIDFCNPILQRFVREAPNARLRFVNASDRYAEELLLRRDLDFAVIGNSRINNSELVNKEISTDYNLCAAWSENQIFQGALTLQRYADAEHLQISIDGESRGVADKFLESVGKTRRVMAVIPHYSMAPETLVGTQLLAIVGSRTMLSIKPSDSIRLFSPPMTLPLVSVSMVYNKIHSNDPANLWLRAIVLDHMENLEIKVMMKMAELKVPLPTR